MYLVRRFLHFSWDEWVTLPGYQQRVYIDQLKKFQPWTDDGGPEDGRGSARPGGGGRELDMEAPISGRLTG